MKQPSALSDTTMSRVGVMKSWSAPSVPVLPGRGPQLRLYDSADRQVRPVTPGATATMYVCGITPYDATHLGHAATYLTFDLVHRVWRDAGHEVHYVQNITDVDDPLFERAQRDGIGWRELADRETDLFREDMAAMRVLPPHDYIAATEAVAEVIEVVEKLLASGAAYVIDDPQYPDVYFHAGATAQFGYESGYDRETMLALFAASLYRPPSLIERLARLREPDLPPEGVRYTRRVTQLWCLFFVLNGSVALYTALFTSLATWTLYNGFIAYLLMGTLFAVELLCRTHLRKRQP